MSLALLSLLSVEGLQRLPSVRPPLSRPLCSPSSPLCSAGGLPPIHNILAASTAPALGELASPAELVLPVGESGRLTLDVGEPEGLAVAQLIPSASVLPEPILAEFPPLPDGVPAAAPPESAEVPSLKEIVVFALPTLAMMLSSPLLSLIDTSVVGLAASTAQLAALGPSTKACDHLAYLCSALGVACTSLAAKELAHDGPGATDKARRVVSTSLTSALAIGTAITVALGVGAAPLMRAIMGAAPDAVAFAGAVQYTTVRAIGYPAALVAMVLQAGFIANKDSRSPMLAVPFAAAANLLLDFILVGPLKLGAAGAAWGTVASQVVSAAFLLRIWHKKYAVGVPMAPAWSPSQDGACGAPAPATPLRWWRPRSLPGAPIRSLRAVVSIFSRPKKDEVAAQVAVVAPMMLAISARSGMALSFTATVASLGTIALAAHQVFECLYWLFCPFGDALGVCSQAYMPKLLAAKERLAMQLQNRVTAASASLGLLSGAACTWLAAGMPQLFTRHAVVHAAMAPPAIWIGYAMFAYIISGALEGSLLARRKLKLLAASHVSNFFIAVGVLRAVARGSAFSLVQVWQIYVAINVAKVLQFSVALALGSRKARWEEAQRDASLDLWSIAPEDSLIPRTPRVLHVSEDTLYELIGEELGGQSIPHQPLMQP